MPYALVEVEATEPLPTLSLSMEQTGVAVLLRRKNRPIDFWMEALPAGSVLAPEDLARRIAERSRTKLVSESLREELAPPARPGRLPSLTVAVCTKDRPDWAARCVESIRALDPCALGVPVSLEILVVDNAPSDERTRERVASLPGVQYTREPRPGLNFARNRALQEATGELLAYVDDDVMVDRGWLEGLMEAWTEHPDAAAFTGLVLPLELETEAQILFERRGGFRRGFEKIRYGQTLPGNPLYPCGAGIFGAGANMAFRRDLLLEMGGFDEALDTGAPLPGGGDLDIFYRTIRAGYSLVYEPRYLVFHEHRREIEALRRQYRSWGLGFMAFVDKCYRTDPALRPRLRQLVWWWFRHYGWQVQKSVRNRHVLPPDMVLAELWGGVAGIAGEYRRSARRIEQIRRRFE